MGAFPAWNQMVRWRKKSQQLKNQVHNCNGIRVEKAEDRRSGSPLMFAKRQDCDGGFIG